MTQFAPTPPEGQVPAEDTTQANNAFRVAATKIVRQIWGGTIRAKLIASFVIVSVLSLGAVAFFVTRSAQSTLENQIGNSFAERAESNLELTNAFFLEKVSQLYVQVLNDVQREAVEERNASYTGSQAQILAQIKFKMKPGSLLR